MSTYIVVGVVGIGLFAWYASSSPQDARERQSSYRANRPTYSTRRVPNPPDAIPSADAAQGQSDASQANAPHSQITGFQASRGGNDGTYHLLLCATGSVATIKIPNICHALSKYGNLSVRVLLSRDATKFLQGQSAEQPHWNTLPAIKNVAFVHLDWHEWEKPWVRGDNILHIELRRWADMMVIAPLSANSLTKLALGMSDNLITSVARAWDTTGAIDPLRRGVRLKSKKKTIMVAPAMNTAMWHHPITSLHMDWLEKQWSVKDGGWMHMLRPIDKGLACGDVGTGAMREWTEIVSKIEEEFVNLREPGSSMQ